MDSFIHVSGWSGHLAHSPKLFSHARSFSSLSAATQPAPAPAPATTAVKSKQAQAPMPSSASQISVLSLSPKTTTTTTTAFFPSTDMSTLPDPRNRNRDRNRNFSASAESLRSTSPCPSSVANPPHPDLSDEVATLSTKLINAINHQTALDDSLSATRQDLEAARDHIRDLEEQVASQREMLSGDVWVRKSTLDNERRAVANEKKAWQAQLAEETTRRVETEREKRKIEQELENLTAALFEEANRMVIGAKEESIRQQEVLTKKNDQLQSQLADSESLLKSQQEQLSELKQVMEIMVTERDDQTIYTTPSSPRIARFDPRDEIRSISESLAPSHAAQANHHHHNHHNHHHHHHHNGHHHHVPEILAPAPPTSFAHLVQPVLRIDLASYDDFIILIHLSRGRPGNRASAGSTTGLGGSTSSAHPSNSSASSLSTFSPVLPRSTPQSPNTPASTASGGSTPLIPALKETRFYKRVLTEDVEPTLRLDAAPGLSWLARRNVLSSVTDGSLIVEPVPVSARPLLVKPQHFPCAMCGESRRDEAFLRNYRFRTSEADSAQRYPLCGYCLNRVRSTCQFLGFLRMVKDGYWRAEDADQEKAAWEESVRLREQMFWARIGGGVIPVVHPEHGEHDRSRRSSRDQAIQHQEGQITEEADSQEEVDRSEVETNEVETNEVETNEASEASEASEADKEADKSEAETSEAETSEAETGDEAEKTDEPDKSNCLGVAAPQDDGASSFYEDDNGLDRILEEPHTPPEQTSDQKSLRFSVRSQQTLDTPSIAESEVAEPSPAVLN